MRKLWVGLAIAIACAWGAWFAMAIPVSASANMWGGCWYLVQRGDTLFSIGVRYGVSPYYLAEMNGLYNPNYIFAGMRLQVPCDRYPQYPPKYPPPPHQPCTPNTTYYVRPGDNLFRIAVQFGTTISALRDANQLWGRVLHPGVTLTIPCPNPNQPPTVPPTKTPKDFLPPEPSAKVIIGFGPDPTDAPIKVGQSVVWVNNTGETITIVSGIPGQPSGAFNSGALPNGGTFVALLNIAGTYPYFVMEHPTMVGQVTVSP